MVSLANSYDFHGCADNPAVILIHGLGLKRQLWAPYIEALSQDYYLLNYDLLGHGNCPAPQDDEITLASFAKQLADLCHKLDIKQACLIGFSLGGMINRRVVLDYPELVSSLIILNSPHERGDEAQTLVEERARQTKEEGIVSTIDATLERWFTPKFRHNNPEYLALIKDWVLANDLDAYARCRWVLAHGVRELIHPQPPIKQPSLVVTCEFDSGSTPEMSHRIAAEIQGAEVMIIPKLQHMGLLERVDLFSNKIVNFLNKTNY